MQRWLTILVLGTLTFASAARSTCEEPVIPQVPNPDLASEIEMLRAQAAVKHYILLQEEFLAFLKKHEIEYDPRYIWD